MAETSTPSKDSCDINNEETPEKLSSKVKFTSQTTFIEVLEHNLGDLKRTSIINLKKEVIADLVMYTINKLHKQAELPSKPAESSILTDIQSTCMALQQQIAETERTLLTKANVLEETLNNKIKDTQKVDQQNHIGHHKHVNKSNVTKNVTFDHVDHVDHHADNFIDETTEAKLIDLCEKLAFQPESGHGVCSFGEVYKYNKSKSKDPEKIPEPVKDIIDLLLPDFPESKTISQCLINKFEGPESFLPFHSDDEPTISPVSDIYTVSLGSPSKIKFKHRYSGDQQILPVQGRGLYIMSRKSQALWCHGIEKSAEFQGIRYSITLRTVEKRYHRSTIILGDSNTRNLKFGLGNGTFGYNMPGKAVYSPLIEDLDVTACAGFSNIIIHCGINNIKNRRADVPECANKLIKKVETIRHLCPKSKVTINPILPTKLDYLNARAKQFNEIIFDYMDAQRDHFLRRLNFNVFADVNCNFLKKELGRFNNYDTIHLGSSGIKLLVKLVKEHVCGYRVDGRPYSGVSSMNRDSVNRDSVNRDSVNRDSVNRVGGERMMVAPITTSNEFPVLSQQLES